MCVVLLIPKENFHWDAIIRFVKTVGLMKEKLSMVMSPNNKCYLYSKINLYSYPKNWKVDGVTEPTMWILETEYSEFFKLNIVT